MYVWVCVVCLFVCMYVYMYICFLCSMYVLYVCMYACMHAKLMFMIMWNCMYVYLNGSLYFYVSIYLCMCMYVCVCMYILNLQLHDDRHLSGIRSRAHRVVSIVAAQSAQHAYKTYIHSYIHSIRDSNNVPAL